MARQLSSTTQLDATIPATGTGSLTLAAKIYSDTASTAAYPASVDRWLTLGGIGGSESLVLRREWNGSTHGDCYVNGTAGGRVQAGSVTAGTWQHWAVTVDGSTIRLYQDGAQVGSTSQTQNITSETTIAVGRSDTEGFDGRFAEIGIWTRALSADEIKALSVGFSPGFFRTNLLEYWPLIGGSLVGRRGATLVDTGGSTAGDHPGIYYPTQAAGIVVPTAGGGGGFTPKQRRVAGWRVGSRSMRMAA